MDPLLAERQDAFDLLIEVEACYLAQRDRIDWKMARENESGSVDRTLHREFAVAQKILMAHAQLQLDLGFGHVVPVARTTQEPRR